MLTAALIGFCFGFFGSIPVAGPIAALVLKRGLTGRFRSAALVGAGGAIAAHLPLPVLQTMAALHECFPAALASGTATREQIGIACLLGNPALNPFIVAISVGSVFFGANTYIGNGPNFMVKAIADQKRVHAPDFIAYVLKFTLPFMLPMLVLVWWLFFRG